MGRRRKLIRKSALVLAQGTRKECCLEVCQDAVREGSTDQADTAVPTQSPRVWQQGEKCASRRCKLETEEHTEKVSKHFCCFTSWFSYKRIFGHIYSLVLPSGYYPFTNPLRLGKTQGSKLRMFLPGQSSILKTGMCFTLKTPKPVRGW